MYGINNGNLLAQNFSLYNDSCWVFVLEMESKVDRVQNVSLISFAFKSIFKSDKRQSRLSYYTVPVPMSEKYKKVDGRMSADLNKNGNLVLGCKSLTIDDFL